MIAKAERTGWHATAMIVATVLDAVADTIHVDEEDMEIYTSGATNIFKYPELADKTKASELISAFEEKQQLVDLVKEQYVGYERIREFRYTSEMRCQFRPCGTAV